MREDLIVEHHWITLHLVGQSFRYPCTSGRNRHQIFIRNLWNIPSIAFAAEKRLDPESWNEMHVNPDSGVRCGYWQLVRKISINVNIKAKTQRRGRKLTGDYCVNGEKEVDETGEKDICAGGKVSSQLLAATSTSQHL